MPASTSQAGFASNGYGEHSPGGYRLLAGAGLRSGDDLRLPVRDPGLDPWPRARGLRAHRHRPVPDPDPPDLHSGDQHLGQSGALHRRPPCSRAAGRCSSCGCSGWRRSWARRRPASSTGWSAATPIPRLSRWSAILKAPARRGGRGPSRPSPRRRRRAGRSRRQTDFPDADSSAAFASYSAAIRFSVSAVRWSPAAVARRRHLRA